MFAVSDVGEKAAVEDKRRCSWLEVSELMNSAILISSPGDRVGSAARFRFPVDFSADFNGEWSCGLP